MREREREGRPVAVVNGGSNSRGMLAKAPAFPGGGSRHRWGCNSTVSGWSACWLAGLEDDPAVGQLTVVGATERRPDVPRAGLGGRARFFVFFFSFPKGRCVLWSKIYSKDRGHVVFGSRVRTNDFIIYKLISSLILSQYFTVEKKWLRQNHVLSENSDIYTISWQQYVRSFTCCW